MLNNRKYLIVGAGFFGAVVAERIARVLNKDVLVIDSRHHIGGTCYSSADKETGIECHRYGSHIFHTKLSHVWEYITLFTQFNNYQHHVYTRTQGQVFSMPMNLGTINQFYQCALTPSEAQEFLAREIKQSLVESPQNLEEKAISLIGKKLYDAFIKGYTTKQWGCSPQNLPADIINRLPFRHNYNTNYFDDQYQGIPVDGYTTIFERLLDHPRIEVKLGVEFLDIKDSIPKNCTVIYTGMVDRLFGEEQGALGWRSLNFAWENHDLTDYQGCSVMNYADLDVPYTRVHEFKHYHPERTTLFHSRKSSICKEYPQDYTREKEAYYPVNTPQNQELYAFYTRKLAESSPHILLGGRLGAYQYWDMDKTIANALALFQEKILPIQQG